MKTIKTKLTEKKEELVAASRPVTTTRERSHLRWKSWHTGELAVVEYLWSFSPLFPDEQTNWKMQEKAFCIPINRNIWLSSLSPATANLDCQKKCCYLSPEPAFRRYCVNHTNPFYFVVIYLSFPPTQGSLVLKCVVVYMGHTYREAVVYLSDNCSFVRTLFRQKKAMTFIWADFNKWNHTFSLLSTTEAIATYFMSQLSVYSPGMCIGEISVVVCATTSAALLQPFGCWWCCSVLFVFTWMLLQHFLFVSEGLQ